MQMRISAGLIALIVVWGLVSPETLGSSFSDMLSIVTKNFGWLYLWIVLALVFLTTIVAKREPDGRLVTCLEALYLGFAAFAFMYSLMLPSRLLNLQLARFDELVESRRNGQKSE